MSAAALTRNCALWSLFSLADFEARARLLVECLSSETERLVFIEPVNGELDAHLYFSGGDTV